MMRLGLALCLLLIAAPAWAATAHVQANSVRDLDGNSTASVSTLSNVTAGNTVFGTVWWAPTTSNLSGITACGNTATLPGSTTSQGTNQSARNYYYANVSSGACTITATFDAAVTSAKIIVHEGSGIDTTTPLDVQALNAQLNPGTGTDAVTSGSVTITNTGSYVYGGTAENSGTTITPGTGYTQGIDTTTRESEYIADFGSTGSKAATFTATNGTYITSIMVFNASGAGGGSSAILLRRRIQ